jgi:hypothetical protein
VPSLRARRIVLTCVVLAVWIGALGFGGSVVWPVARNVWALHYQTRDAQAEMAGRRGAGHFPTRGLIREYQRFRQEKEDEVRLCSDFHLQGSRPLKEMKFKSYEADGYQFAENYRSWKKQMVLIARRPDFLAPYAWEKAEGHPSREEFRAIEKGACVVEVLVRILQKGATEIENLEVGAPVEGAAPAKSQFSFPVARYRQYPVGLKFKAPFGKLGDVLDLMLSVQRSGPADPPAAFMIIDGLTISEPRAESVWVTMHLNVLDFYEPGS